jgi:drug/metabolite transporter (DMT)-like permease
MSDPMSSLDSAATTVTTPAPRDWVTPLELLALGAIWGSSFLFMRVAANDFGPAALVEVRLVAGLVILLPFLWRGRALIRPAHWPKLALIGALNSAVPFALFAWAPSAHRPASARSRTA